MKDIVYELIPEKTKRLQMELFNVLVNKIRKNGNMIKTQYHLYGEKVKNHNEINQRELLTTESSRTLTESLNAKNDMVDNSTIEKENDLNSYLTSCKEGDYACPPGKISQKD